MSIENLKQTWQKSFDKSIKSIENYLTPSSDTYQDEDNFRVLAKWLLENPHSSYDYMTSGHQNFRSTPFGTESVLAILHHALCDDGEVSFVKMKIEGEVQRVFMIFIWQHEDCFIPICKKENESLINSFIGGRESMQRVMTSIKEKNPEKSFNIKPPIVEDEIVFEAHRDPIQFIKDIEEFQLQKQKQREDNAAWIEQMTTKKSRKP